jgi:hypothetical protein
VLSNTRNRRTLSATAHSVREVGVKFKFWSFPWTVRLALELASVGESAASLLGAKGQFSQAPCSVMGFWLFVIISS